MVRDFKVNFRKTRTSLDLDFLFFEISRSFLDTCMSKFSFSQDHYSDNYMKRMKMLRKYDPRSCGYAETRRGFHLPICFLLFVCSQRSRIVKE